MTETKSRIAYVVYGGRGGLEAFIHREITALISRGIDIELFFTQYRHDPINGPEKSGWKWHCFRKIHVFVAIIKTLRACITRPKLAKFAITNGVIREFALACYYASIMRHENITHIHCHFGDRKLTVGFFCAELLGLSLSVTIHAHEIHKSPNPYVFKCALKRCDRIFAISDYTREKLVEKFDAPEDTVITSRLFVDCKKFDSNLSAVTVLTVGRFVERKGHKYLLEAAKLLREENIRFIIIGFGPLDIRQMVADYGLEDSVIVFDKMSQKELRFFYSKADIFCLPSVDHPEQGPEGLPVVLMEAMAAGMPVITTATGGTIELVNEVIVSQYDPEAIAANIKRLAENPDLCRQMGRENQQIIRNLYSPENLNVLYDTFKGTSKPMGTDRVGGKIEGIYEAKAGRESLYSYK
jgi:glycosyltransferase involved in cell wall biosynthesis